MTADRDWWRQAVVYQVYPRSFADSDGDGVGDLAGLLTRVDYLAALGVDAVWLSPFYPSPLADGGYDVADYRDVDPRLGTLADFDAVVSALHARGIRIVVDIVPNHTSEAHAWFQAALASPPGSRERARYHFRSGGEAAPSDWRSMFGGPAWTRLPDGDWFLHTFAREQPDLNWDDPEVRAEFLDILRFWSDRGVDGFRIDVAQMLLKDLSDPLPTQEELRALPKDGTHPLEDRDDLVGIYREWRALFDTYDPPRFAVAEAWVDPERIPRYASTDTLGQAFTFDLMEADFTAAAYRETIERGLAIAATAGSTSTWVLSNHDIPRVATRYALPDPDRPRDTRSLRTLAQEWMLRGAPAGEIDLARGIRRARAAALLMLALPGSAYLYQGEELGLFEVTEIAPDARQDPSFFRSNGADIGRDGSRVPLPWTREGSSFGFGSAGAHLPQPTWFADLSVESEEHDPASTLTLYRRALALRRELQTDETLDWVPAPDGVLHLRRANGWESITNFTAAPVAISFHGSRVVLSSGTSDAGTATLPAETTVWLAPTPAAAEGTDL